MKRLRGATPNIYEFRNYRTTPGAVRRWLQLFTGVLEVREKYTRNVGLWATEAPQVNEVCHIWAYSDLNARAAARAAMLASFCRETQNRQENCGFVGSLA